jgi:hypothetical protein
VGQRSSAHTYSRQNEVNFPYMSLGFYLFLIVVFARLYDQHLDIPLSFPP